MWSDVAPRREPMARAGSLAFSTTTSEDGRVGGHKGDPEPGDLAAAVAPARIPEVGEAEAEAEPCVSNPVVT